MAQSEGGRTVTVMKGPGRGIALCSYGIVIAAVAGGVWGIAHMAQDPNSFLAEALTSDTAQAEPAGSVTLPDSNGNGIPDAYETEEPGDGSTPGEGEEPSEVVPGGSGKGDEDETSTPVPAPEPEPEQDPKAMVYVIQEGDTLSEISGETGVPLDLIVDANGIQNPNLIYAGASLVLPPV